MIRYGQHMATERAAQQSTVDLSQTDHECRARWRHPGEGTWAVMSVVVGELADGRWYVDVIGLNAGRARVFDTKQGAWAGAKTWMATRRGEWVRVPCYPTA